MSYSRGPVRSAVGVGSHEEGAVGRKTRQIGSSGIKCTLRLTGVWYHGIISLAAVAPLAGRPLLSALLSGSGGIHCFEDERGSRGSLNCKTRPTVSRQWLLEIVGMVQSQDGKGRRGGKRSDACSPMSGRRGGGGTRPEGRTESSGVAYRSPLEDIRLCQRLLQMSKGQQRKNNP